MIKIDLNPDKEGLDSYTKIHFVTISDQKEWEKKTIRTREKVRKLGWMVMDKMGRRALYETESKEIEIIRHLMASIKVNETFLTYEDDKTAVVCVTTLSQKGVDWCNEMWEKVK